MKQLWITVCQGISLILLGAIAPHALAQSAPANASPQPCRGRLVNNQCLPLRSTFFEEERRLRFGFTDFLDAALDGAGNALNTNIRNPDAFVLDNLPLSGATPLRLLGTLTVQSRNEDDPTFLQSTFNANGQDIVNIANVRPNSNPQTGTLDLTLNGTPLLNAPYRASATEKNDRYSGLVEVTDPRNPAQVILIEVLPTSFPGASNTSQPVSGSARLSIGRPVDR